MSLLRPLSLLMIQTMEILFTRKMSHVSGLLLLPVKLHVMLCIVVLIHCLAFIVFAAIVDKIDSFHCPQVVDVVVV